MRASPIRRCLGRGLTGEPNEGDPGTFGNDGSCVLQRSGYLCESSGCGSGLALAYIRMRHVHTVMTINTIVVHHERVSCTHIGNIVE